MGREKKNILLEVLRTAKPVFVYVSVFSLFINILLLLVPIYSLQILDRVLSTGSLETLFWLSALVILAFLAIGSLQALRSFTLIRMGEWLDESLGRSLLKASLTTAANTGVRGTQNLRDLSTIKGFLTGNALSAIFDAPWSIVFLLVIFIIHPHLGMITLLGCVLLTALAWLNEVAMHKPLDEANETHVKNLQQVDIAMRNAEAIEAMGMTETISERWRKVNYKVTVLQSLASYRSAILQAQTKFCRLGLQVAIIGWGAFLAIHDQITGGAIIAASILTARALAPFDVAISTWKSIVEVRKSYHRLSSSIDNMAATLPGISFPIPEGSITVEKLVYGVPGRNKPILKGVSFSLNAGDILGVIGPSAAGKSTLARLIVGTWKPYSGVVRLDGADVNQWKREEFGRHVGYLPQDVELFSGTVKDNIARMVPDVSDRLIIKAAQMAGAHEMIMQLQDGYNTEIGPGGAALSAGQRQQIGLARAFFGDPKLIVLDEPDASLDSEGENALSMALENARENRITTLVITHRKSLLKYFNKLMVVKDGEVSLFGHTHEVIQALTNHEKNARGNNEKNTVTQLQGRPNFGKPKEQKHVLA